MPKTVRNQFDKIKNNVGMLLLLSTIVTFNIIIGANEKGLRVLPISILMALNILYLIVLKLKSKNKSIIFKSKVDYLVLLFMLSTTLPLIFKTYASYSDSVEFVMKYFFIYSVYVLSRNVIREEKHIEYIIVTTLISSCFSVIFFYDYNNAQYLKSFMKWIDITYEKNTMFYGTFGYANTQAIYSALCIFLAMHRFGFNKNRVLKVLDVLYIIFELYLVCITESRAVLILIGLTWFVMFVIKFRKQIAKHKIKVIIGVCLSIILASIFLSIALKVSKKVTKQNEELNQEIKYSFKQNQKYTLELELETIYMGELEAFKDSSFIIQIREKGRYFLHRKLASATFGEFNGKYKIEFTPTKDTDTIKLKILNKYNGIIKINDYYINGEKHILNYKYIPNDLAYILSGYTMEGKSLPQRLQMYKDCLKMFKDSWVIGHGGNSWKNLSLAYAEYKGALKESHSYFFELLISYGVIGVIAFLTFILYFFVKVFKQCIKDKEKCQEKILIAIGLFILLVHSITFDFNMSFMLIQLMVYICVAILLRDEQEEIKKNNKLEIFVIIFLVFILGVYIRADISKYLLKDISQKHYVVPYNRKYYNEMINYDIKNKKDGVEILNELQDYIKKEPYYTQNENYERYFNIIIQNLDKLSNEELEQYLDFVIKRIKNIKVKKIMYFDFVKKRTQILANAVQDFEDYAQESHIDDSKTEILNNTITELKSIIRNEYTTNMNNLMDFERNGYEDNIRENFKKKYLEMVNSID